MLRQKTTCCNRTWEECNKSAETKRDNVATRFVSWMSTSGRTYHDIKAHVATLKTRREQKFCRDKVSYIVKRNQRATREAYCDRLVYVAT